METRIGAGIGERRDRRMGGRWLRALLLWLGLFFLSGCGGAGEPGTAAAGSAARVDAAESGAAALAIDIVAANDAGNRAGASAALYDAQGALLGEQTADAMGGIVFALPEAGEYQIRCASDGFFPQTVSVTAEEGETLHRIVALVPELMPGEESDAYVLLSWSGAAQLDLDLCGYDAGIQEYVDVAHPVDRRGSFVYAARDAEDGYELLRLREIEDAAERSVYVLDREAAQTGARSVMETQAVELRVYTAAGEIESLRIDPAAEGAALWRALVLSEGVFRAEALYYEDLTEQAWVGMREEDQVVREIVPVPEWKSAYLEYLMGLGILEAERADAAGEAASIGAAGAPESADAVGEAAGVGAAGVLETVDAVGEAAGIEAVGVPEGADTAGAAERADMVEMAEITAEAAADFRRGSFDLMRMDDDEIPELMCLATAEDGRERMLLLSCHDGEISTLYRESERNACNYIPYSGCLLMTMLREGRMDYELCELAPLTGFSITKRGYSTSVERRGEEIAVRAEGDEICEWDSVPIRGYISFVNILREDFDMEQGAAPDIASDLDAPTLTKYLESAE